MFKKIIIGLSAIVVVAVGGLWAAVTYFLDDAMIAEQMKKEVSSRFNRTLVFQGDLKTNFFPKVQLVLPPTTLSFEGSDKPQFTLKGAQIGVAVLPLIKGDIRFDDIVIDGLTGKVNAARLAKKTHSASTQQDTPKTNEQPAQPAESSFIRNLEVASLEIKDAALTVYGLQNKKVYAVDSLSLSTGQLGLSGTTPLKFSTNFSEKTQNLSGQLSVDSTVTYDVKKVEASLSKPMLTVSLDQQGQKISAEMRADLISYVNSDLSLQKVGLTAKVGEISAKIDMQSAHTEKMQKWASQGLTVNIAQGESLKASVSGDFSGKLDGFTLLSQGLKGEVLAALNNATAQVPFEGTVSLAVPEEKVNLKLKGSLDKSPWDSSIQVKGFAVPNVNGHFTLDSLVLDKWLAEKAPEQKKASLDSVELITSAYADQVKGLTFLNSANGQFKIHVNSLKYQGLQVQGVDTTATLSKGQLALNNIKANTCSGTVTGSAKVNASEHWALNVNAKGIDTEELIKAFGSQVQFYGKANATVQLAGIGIEKTAMLKSANGTISMAANNAVLKGLSLEKVASAVRAKNAAGLVMHPQDETRFSVLSVNASVGYGVLDVRSVQGKASVAEVNGQMKVGLLDNTLSGDVSAKLATSVDGRRVTVPIKLGGTIQSPTYGINIEAALKEGVKTVIEEAVKNPKILEGLGKLFRH